MRPQIKSRFLRKAASVILLGAVVPAQAVAGDVLLPHRPNANAVQAAVEQVPAEYVSEVRRAIRQAGTNGKELIRAIDRAPSGGERQGIAFLIAHMPSRDLRELDAAYLLDNARWAYQARQDAPWGQDIPEDIFLNDVLPYASVNERRDEFRKDFYDRFIKTAVEQGTIEKAVKKLNTLAFEELNVQYDAAKRPKPDQSPYESMAARYASCTGLSVLLVDVLRSVGIPARLAGVPQWSDKSGNHTWVEVWDNGWHFIGAAEPGEYDKTWFTEKAARTDPSLPEHRIYAASFRRTGLKFPLIWNLRIRYVHAEDVTARYTSQQP